MCIKKEENLCIGHNLSTALQFDQHSQINDTNSHSTAEKMGQCCCRRQRKKSASSEAENEGVVPVSTIAIGGANKNNNHRRPMAISADGQQFEYEQQRRICGIVEMNERQVQFVVGGNGNGSNASTPAAAATTTSTGLSSDERQTLNGSLRGKFFAVDENITGFADNGETTAALGTYDKVSWLFFLTYFYSN